MRGHSDNAKLISSAEVVYTEASALYKAVLRIAAVGTWFGEPRVSQYEAEVDLNDLIGKHIPGGMESAGIPAYKPAVHGGLALIDKLIRPESKGRIEPDPSLHEPNEVRRQLGHHFNDPGY